MLPQRTCGLNPKCLCSPPDPANGCFFRSTPIYAAAATWCLVSAWCPVSPASLSPGPWALPVPRGPELSPPHFFFFPRAVGFSLPGLSPKELPNLPLSFPVTGSAHTVALWGTLAGQWEEAAMVCTLAN